MTVRGRNSGGTSVRNAAIVSCAAAIAVDVALGGPAATGPWNMNKGRSGVGRSSGGRSATLPTSTMISDNISRGATEISEMMRAMLVKSVSQDTVSSNTKLRPPGIRALLPKQGTVYNVNVDVEGTTSPLQDACMSVCACMQGLKSSSSQAANQGFI